MRRRLIRRLVGLVLVSALAVAAAGTAAVPPAGASPVAPAWTVEPSADVSAASVDTLTSISCPTAGFCAAVGTTGSGAGATPFAEIEKGHAWSIRPLADTTPPTLSALDGVSCSSSKFCMAVGEAHASGEGGSFIEVPAAETWNGKSWRVITVPTNPPGSGLESRDELTAVSCPSSTFCAVTVVTVGVTFVGNEPTSVDKGYAETWNGSTWTVSTIGAQPLAVSCSDPTHCVAGGTEGGAAAGSLLVLGGDAFVSDFHGSTWSDTDFPLPAASENGLSGATLDAVSCVSASCLATGTETLYSDSGGTYTALPSTVIDASTSGGGWSTTAVPIPSTALNGLACVAVGSCVGVGACTTASCGGSGAPLISRLDSGIWTVVPDPLATAVPGTLESVSCGTRSRCTAAGDQLRPAARSLVVTGTAKPR